MTNDKKVTILCIDDSEDICFSLKTLFQTQGWVTVTEPGVREGIAAFEQFRPQLVLIDYHMPGINGLEGVRLLRAVSNTVPILVLTIDEDQNVANAFLEAGASDFALKPIKAPDLISRVRLHLRLLEQQQSYIVDKGINRGTLDLIVGYMKQGEDALTSRQISEGTGLAYQTVSRYLQHMSAQNLVKTESNYGKVGRPIQLYRLIS
ncbi:MAG: response regulator [Lachnospiraceae bacterium]|nr:response regulator [Lachnospiraceae bacterium]